MNRFRNYLKARRIIKEVEALLSADPELVSGVGIIKSTDYICDGTQTLCFAMQSRGLGSSSRVMMQTHLRFGEGHQYQIVKDVGFYGLPCTTRPSKVAQALVRALRWEWERVWRMACGGRSRPRLW